MNGVRLTRSVHPVLGWISIVYLTFGTGLGTVTATESYLLLQSTTSTVNSGLLDAILPHFTKQTGVEVRVVSSGTGQALRSARNGDADLVLVHSKHDEEKFVAEGYGLERFDLMYNDFVMVGPPNDPAGVRQAQSAAQALSKIATAEVDFVSRGDESGTHKKEIRLWSLTNRDFNRISQQPWYLETGSGMGATLNIAVNKNAYTLSDRGTWILFGNKSDFQILFEGSEELFNPYGLILVNPKKYSHVNAVEGQTLIDWLIGEEGQQRINSYRINGKQLFFANAK
ncbi:MAG: substrate-binding domain-containing protein [Dehalococcoidia bacterium]|nr:substrate-binding domain-containing protein [Dehalococcoidia bacterium]